MSRNTEDVAGQLREKEKELASLRTELEELKITLKVLMNTRSDFQATVRQNVLLNVGKLIKPIIEELKQTGLNDRQNKLLESVVENFDNAVVPDCANVAGIAAGLTPTELKVAGMIKAGKTNKEISAAMNRSLNTVQSHRFNLRKKLGLQNRKVNLRSYLQAQRID